MDPGQARYAYVYAVALHSSGRRDDALAVLRNGLQLHPNDREMLSAALALSREKEIPYLPWNTPNGSLA